jgi:hypothetical protein
MTAEEEEVSRGLAAARVADRNRRVRLLPAAVTRERELS